MNPEVIKLDTCLLLEKPKGIFMQQLQPSCRINWRCILARNKWYDAWLTMPEFTFKIRTPIVGRHAREGWLIDYILTG